MAKRKAKAAPPPPGPWPKLSEMPGVRWPGTCQRCGTRDGVARWLEHDERDRPTAVVVCLCRLCSGAIIEPHPRLYRELTELEPLPGTMPICTDCRKRDGLRCTSEVAAMNGGPGLVYEPRPARVHILRSPRRLSGWQWIMREPVKSCSGKETR